MDHSNYGFQNTHTKDMQEFIWKKASYPHETLVDYESVMFLFIYYNVLLPEK